MRTFSVRLTMLVLLCGGFTAACGDDDPPYVCGDGVCETADGETSAVCPEDCVDYVCGDGYCEAADGENASNCAADCNTPPPPPATCGDGTCQSANGENEGSCPEDCLTCSPPYPVNCYDGLCWSAGTDCTSWLFDCGLNTFHCIVGFPYANCCDGTFATCPSGYPYWCPYDNLCYTSSGACPATCNYRAASCY